MADAYARLLAAANLIPSQVKDAFGLGGHERFREPDIARDDTSEADDERGEGRTVRKRGKPCSSEGRAGGDDDMNLEYDISYHQHGLLGAGSRAGP